MSLLQKMRCNRGKLGPGDFESEIFHMQNDGILDVFSFEREFGTQEEAEAVRQGLTDMLRFKDIKRRLSLVDGQYPYSCEETESGVLIDDTLHEITFRQHGSYPYPESHHLT